MPHKSTTVITPEIVEETTVIVPDRITRINALHEECNGLATQMQELGARMWQTAVRLGGELVALKESGVHGGWGKLFKANSNHGWNLDMTQETARKYMKLFREATKRTLKLEGEETAERMKLICTEGKDDGELVEVLGRISDATTLRQAYFDFGVIEPPQDRNKTILKNRNTKGGKPSEEADPAEDEKQYPQELHDQAMRDGNELMRLLERYFVTEKRAEHLSSGEREALCHAVIEYGKFGKNSNYKMKLSL